MAEKPPEVERRRFYVLSANVEAHGHIESGPGYALFTSHGEGATPRKIEFRERVVRESRRARNERGAVDVPEGPGNRDDEQVAVRHADASGGYIIDNQHEEKKMR